MKKFLLSSGLAAVVCLAAGAALASPQPILNKITPTLPSQTVQPIIQPIVQPIKTITPILQSGLAIDPSILPLLTPTSSSGGPVQIDPSKLQNLKPLPITPITIPPALLKGPVISDIGLASDGKMLQVNWTTDKPGTSRLDYGTSTAYGMSLEDKTLATAHSVIVAVAPGGLHLKISSTDSLKRVSTSEDITLTVPEPTQEEAAATSTEQATTTAPEQPPVVTPAPPVAPAPATPAPQTTDLTNTYLIFGGVVLMLLIIIVLLVMRKKTPPQA